MPTHPVNDWRRPCRQRPSSARPYHFGSANSLITTSSIGFFIKTEEEEREGPFGAVVDGRVYRLKLKTFAALLCCIHRHFSAGSRTCVHPENSNDEESFTRKIGPHCSCRAGGYRFFFVDCHSVGTCLHRRHPAQR